MSEHTTLLNEPLLRYLAGRTTPEDDFLKSLKHAALEEGFPAIWMARALPAGGHVRTIEISGRRADFAETWVQTSASA